MFSCIVFLSLYPHINSQPFLITVHFLFTYLDTDECSSNNSDCEHLCMNEHAAYRCECYQGHQLEPDGKSCIGKNIIVILL